MFNRDPTAKGRAPADAQPAPAPKRWRAWTEIAAELGTNDRRLRQWRNRRDWPLDSATKPADVTADDMERIRSWAAGLQENRSAAAKPEPDDEELRHVADKLKLAQMQLTELKREILAGQYVDRQIHERALLALADMFIAQLNALEQTLPLALADMDAGQREKEIAERFADARRELAHQVQDQLAQAATDTQGNAPKPGRGRPTRNR